MHRQMVMGSTLETEPAQLQLRLTKSTLNSSKCTASDGYSVIWRTLESPFTSPRLQISNLLQEWYQLAHEQESKKNRQTYGDRVPKSAVITTRRTPKAHKLTFDKYGSMFNQPYANIQNLIVQINNFLE